jgi:hypothetical protein
MLRPRRISATATAAPVTSRVARCNALDNCTVPPHDRPLM